MEMTEKKLNGSELQLTACFAVILGYLCSAGVLISQFL